MEQTLGASGPPGDEPSDSAANAPASGAAEANEKAAQPLAAPRAPSFSSVLFAAVASAVLGSVVLAVCEHAAAALFFPRPMQGETWPGDIVIAATGRMIATYFLFWIPIFAVGGVLYWRFAPRRSPAMPEPFFLALFALLAALVVIPADLEIARRLRAVFLIPGLLAGLSLTAAVYFLARSVHRRVGEMRLRRLFRRATGLAALVALATGFFFVRSPLFDPGAYRVAGGNPPNLAHQRAHVLWIVLDAARADRLGLYGHKAPTTPFLDEWAKQSMVFDRAIANGMWTLPTHASMFTGLPARRHGLGHATFRLDDSFQTVAAALRENGYATGLFSNNILVAPKTNLSKGFDTPLVVYHFQQATRFSLAFLCEKWGITPPVPWLDLDYGAALTNELVARWLDAHRDAPVFVFINYMETHLPFRIPRRYRELFMSGDQVHRSFDLRRRVYGELEEWLNIDALIDGYDHMPPFDREVVKRQYEAALRYLDERVREVIDIFRRRGLLDNTLVVITSDHGEYLDTHGMWSHHFLTYQDVIRVPLLLRNPGRTDQQRVATPVQLSDLYPTVLRATLGAPATETTHNARDLLEVAADGGQPRTVISECFGAELAVGPRLLARSDPRLRHRATTQITAVDSRFQYIRSGDGLRELYDFGEDPGALENLQYSHWEEARRLDDYIEWWLRAVPAYEPKQNRKRVRPDREILDALKALGYLGDEE
ncbi:MAG: sulfatase [Phycisphaerae bacterium]